MNALHAAGRDSATAADPLASVRIDATAIADLAFGSFSRAMLTDEGGAGRHLALLDTQSLALDLSDPAQRRFGNYELVELIGEGGMGVVYRARQASLDRDVAVKLLAAGPWASKSFIERFQREAQNAARMQHPNIVAIYEVDSSEGLHFFSMRLIRGGSLADLLDREHKLPALRAAQLLRTIAEAVDYAHRLGVLHLDLKPANVLLDENGAPHVADFGLARRMEQGLAADNNEISGTPSYMAPEQATAGAQKITPATDVWGLGAIFYELVAGRPPFVGATPQATLKLLVAGRLTNPRDLVPDLPRDLAAIIEKCMAYDVADRYATARALADDVGRFLENRAVQARPLNAVQRTARWAKRQPYVTAFAALFVLSLLVGIAGIAAQWKRAEGNARAATVSTDLANERLWQARIDQAEVMLRDGHNYDALPALAANIKEREAQGLDAREDRIRLAMVERSAPRLIDVIALGATIRGVAISPDGSSVAASTEDEVLRLFDAATGKQRWHTSFKGATHFFTKLNNEQIPLVMLRFTADGRHLIGRSYTPMGAELMPWGLDEILLDATDGKVMTPPAERAPEFSDATYSADGAFAIVRYAERRKAVLMRTADWQPVSAPAALDNPSVFWLLTNAARYAITYIDGDLQIRDPRSLMIRHAFHYERDRALTTWVSSPDGKSILAGHLDGLIERVDCASGRREAVSPSPLGRVGWITFSPDGRWFGAVADSGQVLVWDTATGKLLTPPMHLNTTPELHRDQIFIDAAARTIIASADWEMGLWYAAGAATLPVRLSGEFPVVAVHPLRAFAYDAAHGLIASDGGQGELRLWRVQRLASNGMYDAPLPAVDLRADDRHVVQAQGNAVRVVDAADGRAVGPWLQLPQPANSAQLSVDRNSLVAVVGNLVFVYDAAKWTLRRAPIALPNDPAELLPSPDARHALIRFADYHNGASRELAQNWDLVNGAAVSPAVPISADAQLRFNKDGQHILRWHLSGLQVLDATTLQSRWPLLDLNERLAAAHEAEPDAAPDGIAIAEAQFSQNESRIDVLTANAYDLGGGVSRLWQIDAAKGTDIAHFKLSETHGGENFVVMPDGVAALVQRPGSSAAPLWWNSENGVRELPKAYAEGRALTLAPDASMFARGVWASVSQAGAMLTSTRGSHPWVSPLMPEALPARDPISHLAFTRDGSGLIARSRLGAWLYWDVSPDPRPIDRISRDAALLNPDQSTVKGGMTPALSDAERQELRADDSGFTPPAESLVAAPYPPRQADAQPELFDLSAFYNCPLGEGQIDPHGNASYELAPGLHRYLGVDYDVRGAIVATAVSTEHPVPNLIMMRGIRPGIARFAALHILMTGDGFLAALAPRPYAIVELDYVDGGRARIPIVYQRDVSASWRDYAPAARVAVQARNFGLSETDVAPHRTFAPRVANPHPERAVASVALEATDEQWSSPHIFAITAEPLADTPAKPSSFPGE